MDNVVFISDILHKLYANKHLLVNTNTIMDTIGKPVLGRLHHSNKYHNSFPVLVIIRKNVCTCDHLQIMCMKCVIKTSIYPFSPFLFWV